MGLKENFYMAMSELVDGPLRPALAAGPSSAAPGPRPMQSSAIPPRRESAPMYASSGERTDFASSSAPVDPSVFRSAEPEGAPPCTVIAEGAVIHGSIRASGGVELYGQVYGDIMAKEGVILAGRLEGNAAGRDIALTGGHVRGNLVAAGRMRVTSGAMILGNIQAAALHLNGSVKGNLEVKDSTVLDTKAVVAGNVTTGRLSIAEGAMLQGEVRTAAPEKLFDEKPGANL